MSPVCEICGFRSPIDVILFSWDITHTHKHARAHTHTLGFTYKASNLPHYFRWFIKFFPLYE
jgi:hypothetical protein